MLKRIVESLVIALLLIATVLIVENLNVRNEQVGGQPGQNLIITVIEPAGQPTPVILDTIQPAPPRSIEAPKAPNLNGAGSSEPVKRYTDEIKATFGTSGSRNR